MNAMRLTIVGCSGSYPGPESPASCYLLEAEHEGRTWRILLDLGNGSLGALQRHADPLTIDAVFLSHLHPDHCMDLCGFYVLRKYHPRGSLPPIPVFGPAGTADRMAQAYDLPPEPGMKEQFSFGAYDDAVIEVGPFAVTAIRVAHPVPAYALQVSAGGRILTYSGDTAACPELVEAARGVDLFLCEASFLDGEPNPPGIHLTGVEAATIAAEAGVSRLMLTHIPPWHDANVVHDQASVYFPGVAMAEAGASYPV
ncbi:MAG TPA: MBL fold metallo-hydrolase [Marmoricola sp.]|nr:MBL fold metallo-hydrolase [Marmoricola sp.]